MEPPEVQPSLPPLRGEPHEQHGAEDAEGKDGGVAQRAEVGQGGIGRGFNELEARGQELHDREGHHHGQGHDREMHAERVGGAPSIPLDAAPVVDDGSRAPDGRRQPAAQQRRLRRILDGGGCQDSLVIPSTTSYATNSGLGQIDVTPDSPSLGWATVAGNTTDPSEVFQVNFGRASSFTVAPTSGRIGA